MLPGVFSDHPSITEDAVRIGKKIEGGLSTRMAEAAKKKSAAAAKPAKSAPAKSTAKKSTPGTGKAAQSKK
jgi:hypothetical protein